MGKSWNLHTQDGIGILEFDCPDTEVNVLTAENMAELRDVLVEIPKRSEIKALIIVSAKKRIFIAGADIKEIQNISTEEDAFKKAEHGKQVVQLLEDLNIPTVTVINGACLGGGYELALATKYRVASFSEKVQIGLPEVKLGILPGFGGSIRLPRLLGLLKALPLILAGKVIPSKDALKNGMVDRLFPEGTLRENAVEFAKEIVQGKINGISSGRQLKRKSNWFLEGTPFGRSLVFKQAKQNVLKETKGFYPAPLQIIDLVRRTCGRKGQSVFQEESRDFSKLAVTPVSKSLIKVFFMMEQYKKFPWTDISGKVPSVNKCGVLGAGVMGGGIAQLVSYKSIPVRVKDINEKALAGALKEAWRIYGGALKRRKITAYDRDYKMGLISVGLTNDGLRRADIIIEAVVENLEIKQKVFKELSELTDAHVILASNTSSLSVNQLADVSKSPERVVGLHFFNPVHRMPLVEIVPSSRTSREVLERTIRFSRTLGKTVIVVKDVPGFLVNRLLLPYMNEAAYLVEEGVLPEELDRIAEQFGMPMGPVELVDQVGIDVGYKVAHNLSEAYGERMKVSSVLEEAKQKGLLGKKSGRGFYIYHGKEKKLNPDFKFQKFAKPIPQEEVMKRLIYIMVNEAARCLDEKVVNDPSTVDIGMIMGTGFSPFRAGLLRYADQVGLPNILADLERFQKSVNRARFEPSPLLERLAETNQTFYQ
ncbi:MAG: enoyl-CoA hydratase/isomerase family protein [Candidatus Omnitrophica bacterium]|nr:enoyl-CoA hydratase/isomerase family protein [Candidatus Omnitrophota bacterium]